MPFCFRRAFLFINHHSVSEKASFFPLLVVLIYQLTQKRFTSIRCSLLNLFTLPLQQGPDYRLYKSEPELTTVTEVDENNGEDRSEHQSEHSGNKGTRGQNHHRNLMTSAQFPGNVFMLLLFNLFFFFFP